MPDDNHKIEKIIYDVNFDSEAHAYGFQANVSSFIQNELIAVIDEVCNELDNKGKTICIDKLELDIGRVKYANYETEIRDRLKEELHKSLREKIVELEHNPSESERVLTKQQSDFLQLIHFLQNGNFPWNRRNGAENSIDKLLQKLLQNNSTEFISWLKTYGKQEITRRRIVNQFKDPQIVAIINKVIPAHSHFISDYTSDLQQTHKKEPVVKASDDEFRSITWDVILVYVLNDRGSRFNRKSFIEYTLRKIAVSQSIPYAKLLKVFSLSVKNLSNKFLFKTEFPDIILELSEEINDTVEDLGSQYKSDDNSQKEKILNQLKEVLNGTQKDLSKLNLKILLDQYPEDLIRILQDYFTNEASRNIVTDIFSEDQIKLIIKTLQPANSVFVTQFSNELDENYDKHKLDQSKSNFRKVKWQIILASLYEDRGSIFNKKEFVKSVIRQLASHYNIQFKELILAFYSSFSQVTQSSQEIGIIKEVLIELKDDLNIEDQKRQLPDNEIQQYINAYDLYEDLIFYLRHGYLKFDIKERYKLESVSSLISELEKSSYQLSLRFYRDIQRPGSLMFLVENTSEEFIQAIIGLIMKISYSADIDSIKTFQKAIKWYGTTVLDKSELYSTVVQLLITRKEINFRKIISDINDSYSKIIENEKKYPFGYFTVKTHLFSVLCGEKGIGAFNKSYEDTWHYLITNYNKKLTGLIQSIISEAWIFKGFLDKSTDDIFLSILKEISISSKTYSFILYLTEVFGFDKQYHLNNSRNKFWDVVFKSLYHQNFGHDEGLMIILKKVLKNVKDNAERQKITSALKSKLSSFSLIEKKDVLKIINLAEESLQNFKKDSIDFESENQLNQARALSLLKGDLVEGISHSYLFEYLLKLMKEKSSEVYDVLYKQLYRENIRHFWVKQFPEFLLRRMVFLLYPQGFIHIHTVSEILWNACSIINSTENYGIKLQSKWFYTFETLAKNKQSNNSENYTPLLIKQLVSEVPQYNEKAFLTDLCKEIEENTASQQKKERLEIIHELKRVGQNLTAGEEASESKKQNDSDSIDNKMEENDVEESEIIETIYIENAGMVLAAPYLPELFKRLDLVKENKFKERQSAERAIHLLQFMVNGNTSLPEYMLLLNKILCGIKTGIPIQREIDITADEKETILQLLEGMIQNWKAIGSASVKGFQESFLQREGVLNLKDENWQLVVESKAYDMLIDQIPWSFTTIKYPWMDKVLYVKWR